MTELHNSHRLSDKAILNIFSFLKEIFAYNVLSRAIEISLEILSLPDLHRLFHIHEIIQFSA